MLSQDIRCILLGNLELSIWTLENLSRHRGDSQQGLRRICRNGDEREPNRINVVMMMMMARYDVEMGKEERMKE